MGQEEAERGEQWGCPSGTVGGCAKGAVSNKAVYIGASKWVFSAGLRRFCFFGEPQRLLSRAVPHINIGQMFGVET